MSRVFTVLVPFLVVVGIGCFEVGGEPAGPPGSGLADSWGGGDSSVPADAAPPTDSSPADTSPGPDATAGDTGPADTGAADTGMTDTGPGASCPDVFGAFSITAGVVGCGDLSASAVQRIDGDRVACIAAFSSSGGINGSATVGATGSLSGASLSLGTGAAMSCTGMWTAATSTMTVVCGAGPSRCTTMLSRIGR